MTDDEDTDFDLAAFIVDLGKRGQGGYVLLVTTYLDDALQTILQSLMPNLSNNLAGQLFDRYAAPFSNFATKIDVLFALAIITEEEQKNLHAFRDLRNAFAHPKGEDVSLDTPDMLVLLRKFPSYRDHDGKMNRYAFIQAQYTVMSQQLTRIMQSVGAKSSPEKS